MTEIYEKIIYQNAIDHQRNWSKIDVEIIKHLTKEWLTQKRQENPYNNSAKAEHSMYDWTIRQLLEELK